MHARSRSSLITANIVDGIGVDHKNISCISFNGVTNLQNLAVYLVGIFACLSGACVLCIRICA